MFFWSPPIKIALPFTGGLTTSASQPTEVPKTSIAPPPTQGTEIPQVTDGPSATPTNDPSPTPLPATSAGLGAGAIAGIAVGVALLVIFLCAGAFLIYRRRKRNTAPLLVPQPSNDMAQPVGYVGGYYEPNKPKAMPMSPAAIAAPVEADTVRSPIELDSTLAPGSGQAYELAGSEAGDLEVGAREREERRSFLDHRQDQR